MSASGIQRTGKVHSADFSSGKRLLAPVRNRSTQRHSEPAPASQRLMIAGSDKGASQVDTAQLVESLAEANQSIQTMQESLHFRVHESSGQLIVEVQDMKTGEVIKTIPPEELLDSMGKIKSAVGAIIDKEG